MNYVKKIIFAPLFLICLVWAFYLAEPILKSSDFIFSFSFATFLQIFWFCVSLILSFFLFVVFVSLAQDWKLILPIILVAGVLPLVSVSAPPGYVITVGLIAVLLFESFLLMNKLKTYITFSAPILLATSVKTLTTLMILIISLAYYFSLAGRIEQKGFQLPESLIDTALKLGSPPQVLEQTNAPVQPQISLTQAQIDQIKSNPDLLKQFGLDEKSFDELINPKKKDSKSTDISSNVTKKLVQDQIQQALKPYQKAIPVFLALFLFLILQPMAAILSIFITPLLWLTFLIFQKTKFVRFATEMREVKKMVV